MYYKIVQGKTIVGAISSIDFRKYQEKHKRILFADEEDGQFVEFKEKYYRDDWLRALPIGTVKTASADIVRISFEEYEALKNNQTRFDKLEEVLEYIQMYYWKDVDTDAMMDGAVQGMLAALDDPYTFYYDKQSWTDMP